MVQISEGNADTPTHPTTMDTPHAVRGGGGVKWYVWVIYIHILLMLQNVITKLPPMINDNKIWNVKKMTAPLTFIKNKIWFEKNMTACFL